MPKILWEGDAMPLRFCQRCASEVEDVGGYCLLGHPLRVDPLIPSVSHIRDEVDRAFEEVGLDDPVELLHVGPPAAGVSSPPEIDASTPRDPLAPVEDAPDPPTSGHHTVWEALHDGVGPDGPDPMAAFAPPPRVDWGPDRPGLLDGTLPRRQGPARR
jgi:hypothetical protein